MRKLLVGAAVTAVCVTMVTVAAPRATAQARQRVRTGPDVLMLRGPGTSIGISTRELTTAEAQKAKIAGGAYVDNVREDTPAARAGLKAGDIVVEFDGERVRSARELTRLVLETPPGRAVKATVVRDGRRQTVEVTPDAENLARLDHLADDINRTVERSLRNLPRNFTFDVDGLPPPIGARARLGATLMSMNDQLAQYFGVKQGVLVSSVADDSNAARAGLKAGDVITAAGGHPVERPSDVNAAVIDATTGSGALDLTVMRDHKEVTIKVDRLAREARP